MKEKLITFLSEDNLELHGILYEPENKTNRIIIYVHGLAGNFYKNIFVRKLAEMYTRNGYAFLTFNNRGHDYFNDSKKYIEGKKQTITCGGAYDLFEDCIYDIQGSINIVKKYGYQNFILCGHSFGCNKVVYYYDKTRELIDSIILLAPCDVIGEFINFMGDDYENYIERCNRSIAFHKPNEIVSQPLFPPMGFGANTFLNNFISGSTADIYRYRLKNEYLHPLLTSIRIPVYIQIGTNDSYSILTTQEETENYLKQNFANAKCKINFIEGANHSYFDKETILCENLEKYFS